MGAFLAKVTLHPVDNMIHTIHQITAENMALKIEVPATKDEIQKLAETFNDMLSRLERAFTTQRQLFEDLSHELKTPLTILKGEFEVTLKKLREQAEYQTVLKSSLEEINRIIKLAEGLLLLARFDSKEVLPEKKRLELNPLIRTVINNVKGISELKQIKISLSEDGKYFLNGDESQLKTMLFDIDNDPGQKKPLSDSAAETCRVAARRIVARRDRS
jgi:signal transduction histidine kinase